MNSDVIFLDHAAATPIDRRVLEVMQPYFSEQFYNPSSPYQPAVEVRRDYELAKHKIASIIGAKPAEIIITAGATESISLAFNSISGHVVVPNIEHHAVLNNAKLHDYTFVAVDKSGRVSPDDVVAAIKDNTELVSVALANNELGSIQPISAIAEGIKHIRQNRLNRGVKTPLYFHCDASQGVGQIDINVSRLGVDMLTLNSGKIYGPKQVGLLWFSSYVKIVPLVVGGGQEMDLRSGTENVAGVVGFAKALELVSSNRKNEVERLTKLRDGLQYKLLDAFLEAVVSGHPKHRLSGHLHIAFPGIDAERLVFALEDRGVLVATGSACSASKGTRSHVLEAIGLRPGLADGSLRLTLGHLSTSENLERAAIILIEEIRREYARVNNG